MFDTHNSFTTQQRNGHLKGDVCRIHEAFNKSMCPLGEGSFWGDGWVGKDARLRVCFKMKMEFENELRKYRFFWSLVVNLSLKSIHEPMFI